MPDTDRIGQMFARLAAERLPVPATADVVARGRQRRRRARLTAAVSVTAAVALCVATAGLVLHVVDQNTGPGPGPVTKHSTSKPAHLRTQMLPPAGSGPLLLGQTADGSFRMARLGHRLSPVPVPGLRAGSGFQPRISTDPAGGWVVVVPAGRASGAGLQSSRLAVVTTSGAVQPFGPVFGRYSNVMGMAVNPAASDVAVEVFRQVVHWNPRHPNRGRRPGLIELVPLPGQPGQVRIWTMDGLTDNQAESLSWQNDTYLTYIPGGDETGGGFAGSGAVTLDVAAPGSSAPTTSTWPLWSKTPGSCHLVAGAWVGARYLALEYCAGGIGNVLVYANPVTGQQLSGRIAVHGFGCPTPELDPALNGREVLVPACQLQLYRPGRKIMQLGSSLFDAAFAG